MKEITNPVKDKIMSLLEDSRNFLYEDIEKSYESAKEALKLSVEEKFKKGEAVALVRLAAVYRVKGDLQKAANLSFEAKNKIEDLSLDIHLVDVLNNLGNIYADYIDYDTALSYYMQASKILEAQEEGERVNYFRYVLNNNIGEIYNELHSYDTAIEYYERSLQYVQNSNKKNYIIVPYVNISEIYQKTRDFDNALLYLNKALTISKESELDFFEPDIFFCFAKIYSDKDMYEEAYENFEKTVNRLKEKEVIYFLVNVLLEFYKFLLKYKKEEKAIEVLKETYEISVNNNYKMKLAKIYSCFAEFYENNKKYSEALKYYKLYYKEEQSNQTKNAEKKVVHLKNQLKINQIEYEKEVMQLKNIQLKEKSQEIEKLYNNISLISEMGLNITAVLDLNKVVSKTEEYFRKITRLANFGLIIYDETGKDFEFTYISGKDKSQSELEKDFLTFHLKNDRKKIISLGNNGSELYVSLIIEERVIGGIYLYKKNNRECSDQDRTVIKAFAGYVAIAVNNAQKSMKLKEANQKLLTLSLKDGLTEIANRRKFEEVLKREWWRAVRYKTPMSVIMFDIDKFKQYNDNYGHLEGDDCIRKIAKASDAFFKRAIDLVARYGGDEFVVILPDTELKDSVELAEKLRVHIENNLKITHDYSAISNYVTITLGVASTYPNNKLTEKELIDAADEALYNAKEDGRNRVKYSMLSSAD